MSKHQQFGWPPIQTMSVAIAYSGFSRWTIQRAVATGKLRVAGRRGRSPLFFRDDLDAWLLDASEPAGPSSTVTRHASKTTNAEALARLREIVNGNG